MIDINVPNVVTIGLIALVSYAAVKMATNAAGINVPWM